MKTGCVVGGLLSLLAGLVSPLRADEPAIAIRAGHLIDTLAGRATGAQIIVVRDGRIVDVGPDVQVPGGARVIDLTAYTVLPGLMDAHTHLTIDVVPGRGGGFSLEAPLGVRFIIRSRMLTRDELAALDLA